MTTKTERPVIVTTAHRGVFFGYTADSTGETIILHRIRACIRWQGTRGFIGLATEGPNARCRVTPAAPSMEVRAVTAVLEPTAAAVAAWEAGPWGS